MLGRTQTQRSSKCKHYYRRIGRRFGLILQTFRNGVTFSTVHTKGRGGTGVYTTESIDMHCTSTISNPSTSVCCFKLLCLLDKDFQVFLTTSHITSSLISTNTAANLAQSLSPVSPTSAFYPQIFFPSATRSHIRTDKPNVAILLRVP